MLRGNILFLILLAVALFAALSYAVTQSTRSSGKNIADEDAQLAATRLIQHASNIEAVVQRLRLSNGCRETQLSFAADSDNDGDWYDTDDNFHNPNAPSDLSCHIFHVNGGNIPPNLYVGELNDGTTWMFHSQVCIPGIGTSSSPNCWLPGTEDDADLIAFFSYVSLDVCEAILETLNLSGPGKNSGTENWNSPSRRFTGSFASPSVNLNYPDGNSGRYTSCFEGDDDNPGYYFYHVIIPR